MATASRYLSRSLLQLSRQIPAKRKRCQRPQLVPQPSPNTIVAFTPRAFTTSLRRQAEDDDDDDDKRKRGAVEEPEALLDGPFIELKPGDLDPQTRADYDQLSDAGRAEFMDEINSNRRELHDPNSDINKELMREMNDIARDIERKDPMSFPSGRVTGRDVGYWADEEDDEDAQFEDDDDVFNDDDIATPAHADLELQREIREYARISAWDLPLLSKFKRSYEPPTLSTPLRFRYTTYMGESHPAASKVVLEFSTRDLAHTASLSEPQRIKLIKLVGVRYNPDTDTVKMSCEKFENAAQNKRYLGDNVADIVKEAKDETDMFEDIPLDFRHHKSKPKYHFPEEWKLKPDRVQQLLAERKEIKQHAEAREIVNGDELVMEMVRDRRLGGEELMQRQMPAAPGLSMFGQTPPGAARNQPLPPNVPGNEAKGFGKYPRAFPPVGAERGGMPGLSPSGGVTGLR